MIRKIPDVIDDDISIHVLDTDITKNDHLKYKIMPIYQPGAATKAFDRAEVRRRKGIANFKLGDKEFYLYKQSIFVLLMPEMAKDIRDEIEEAIVRLDRSEWNVSNNVPAIKAGKILENTIKDPQRHTLRYYQPVGAQYLLKMLRS